MFFEDSKIFEVDQAAFKNRRAKGSVNCRGIAESVGHIMFKAVLFAPLTLPGSEGFPGIF